MAECTEAEWAGAKRQLFDALLPGGAGAAAARLDGMSLSSARPAGAFASPFGTAAAGVAARGNLVLWTVTRRTAGQAPVIESWTCPPFAVLFVHVPVPHPGPPNYAAQVISLSSRRMVDSRSSAADQPDTRKRSPS